MNGLSLVDSKLRLRGPRFEMGWHMEAASSIHISKLGLMQLAIVLKRGIECYNILGFYK